LETADLCGQFIEKSGRIMNSGSLNIFIGRWFGINVRVHFSLVLLVLYNINSMAAQAEALGNDRYWISALVVIGCFFSILLHEFGHALSCRLFKGDADEILLWPLGGLAYCRPPFHPTAHFITTIAGPLVTFVLWIVFGVALPKLSNIGWIDLPWQVLYILEWLGIWHGFLLLFNLLPAFPMDGGRAIRDALWHFIGYTKATLAAVWLGRIVGGLMLACGLGIIPDGILPPMFQSGVWMLLIGGFVIYSTMNLEALMGAENSGAAGYSLKDHWNHAKRSSDFRKNIEALASEAFHRCAACQRTELSDPALRFRVSSVDKKEYCLEHLPNNTERNSA